MMKVMISEITKFDGASTSVKFVEQLEGLSDENGEFSFPNPVNFEGVLTNSGGVLNLEGEATTSYKTFCSVCLEEIESLIKVIIKEDFREKALTDDEEAYYYEGSQLILDKAITDNIILQLPMKSMCSEDCKGVCGICGKNLNKGDCACIKKNSSDKGVTNPKMDALKELMKSFESEEQ